MPNNSTSPQNQENKDSPPVFVFFGPTGSGKTGLLQKLFNSKSRLQAEVVNADSMQVYKGMDIGTAKPSALERERLPHHLIDICNPAQQFNAGDFVRLADEACFQIAKRGKLPVVSGGTGFYLKNFIMGLSEAPPSDKKIREELKKELKEKGMTSLAQELNVCDPVSSGRIHLNDEYRLLRALEVYRFSGRPLSSFEVNVNKKRSCFRFIIIGLSRPREELYRRINERCALMFRQGLADEVRFLFEAGYTPDDPGLCAIGYREFFIETHEPLTNLQSAGLPGESSFQNKQGRWRLSQDINGVQALIAQNSRRYAKRQITFFAGIQGVKWVECAASDEETAEKINIYLNEEYENF